MGEAAEWAGDGVSGAVPSHRRTLGLDVPSWVALGKACGLRPLNLPCR